MFSDKTLVYTKLAVNIVSGMGVTKIVNDIINNNTVSETTFDVVKVWIGSAVIGSMIADHGSKHVDAKIDNIAAWLTEAKEEMDAQ